MTLAELAVTVGVLAVLGLAASRIGLSAIPAYLLAGIILGPNDADRKRDVGRQIAGGGLT